MRKRLLVLLFLNVLLVVALISILNMVGIVNIHWGKTIPQRPDVVSEDPFLMEKESLRKQWAVLTAKENDLEQKRQEFDKQSQVLQEKQKALNTQMENFNNQQIKNAKNTDSSAQSEESIRSLAGKINNVAPSSGAAILSDMEPVVAVEVIKMMDKMAAESGKQSTSAYLLSLMDPAKRKEVVRLLSAYPSSLGNLNIPTPPSEGTPNDTTGNQTNGATAANN